MNRKFLVSIKGKIANITVQYEIHGIYNVVMYNNLAIYSDNLQRSGRMKKNQSKFNGFSESEL